MVSESEDEEPAAALDTTDVSSSQSSTATLSDNEMEEVEDHHHHHHHPNQMPVFIHRNSKGKNLLDSKESSSSSTRLVRASLCSGQISPVSISEDLQLNFCNNSHDADIPTIACDSVNQKNIIAVDTNTDIEHFLDTQAQNSFPESHHTHPDPNGVFDEKNSITTNTTDKNNTATPIDSFHRFRLQYLIVYTAIMLADGLQGTHLYVLYEGYGYTVASLYSLGFVSGALSSPFIGPFVDKMGRKKAAMLYCLIEILINYMEQFPIFTGLIISRVLGGITTNLLFTVFESWLVTEHRKRGYEKQKLEHVLRDSSIVSNSAAIVSGYIAHTLATSFGPVGPFRGAVAFTCFAFLLVGCLWSENYGSSNLSTMTFIQHMDGAFQTIINDTKISRLGFIQGLTEGSLQTFVFLWSPALRTFASTSLPNALGLDPNEEDSNEPAYGLIFGAFMAFGVIGGFAEPTVRRLLGRLFPCSTSCQKSLSSSTTSSTHSTSSTTSTSNSSSTDTTTTEEEVISESSSNNNNNNKNTSNSTLENMNHTHIVNLSCACFYLLSAILLLTPTILNKNNPYAFTICLCAFLLYEWMVGLYLPCESILRSIYMPNESICSIMTMLRVIVNVSVACGVIFTNYVSFTSAFAVLSAMMFLAGFLQLSLLGEEDYLWRWFSSLFCVCGGPFSIEEKKVMTKKNQ